MKQLARTCVCLAVLVSVVPADETVEKKQAAIKLPAPESWRGETIALPPGFARDMKLKGTEVIRFAPGMFQPKSDSFFSYLFVFRIQQEPELKPEIIRREFLKYYRGLAKSVLRGKDTKVDFEAFTFKLTQVKPKKETPAASRKRMVSIGELEWVEPFVTQKPQKLRLEIQTWKESQHNYMFVCVSPQPKDAAIWKQLRKIRDKYQSPAKQVKSTEKKKQ